MTDANITELQSNLLPVAFFLKNSEVYTNDEFVPSTFKAAEMTFQYLRESQIIREADLGADESAEPHEGGKLYIFRCLFGVRGTYIKDKDDILAAEKEDKDVKELSLVQFQIEASFDAHYMCKYVIEDDSCSEHFC